MAGHGEGALARLMAADARSAPALSVDDARAHYDALGAGQDRELRYAMPAFRRLLGSLDLSSTPVVVELGSGTGALAEMALADHLNDRATWLGLDISPVMCDVARRRLTRFGGRADVRTCDGDARLPLPDHAADLVVATYVLDLLSPAAIDRFLAEASRVLRPGGQLAIAGLAPPTFSLAGVNMALWTVAHRLMPRRVGGCRPVRVDRRLSGDVWRIAHRSTVRAAGIQSVVLIARQMT
ncbi:MAG: class I SAM-dependent methyltransferase [Minwuia sp.]|nr:class I SAM-dependent methyltransferase [Minwuia sp.]